jgi:hypothetical protein
VRRSGYLLVITMVLGLLSGAVDSLCQQQQPGQKALPTLTKAHDAHSLTSEQAAQNYPVQLRAVVTYYDRDIRRFGSPTLLAASMLNSPLSRRFLSKRATWLK